MEIYDVRMVLEGLAARRAALRIPEEELEEMANVLREAEVILEEDPERAINADIQLHEMVMTNCDNRPLIKIISDLRDQVQTFRIHEGHQLEVVKKVMKERWDILESLKARDPDKAAETVERHIRGVKERRLAQLPDQS